MFRKLLMVTAAVVLFTNSYCQKDTTSDKFSQIQYDSKTFFLKANKKQLYLLDKRGSAWDTIGDYNLNKKDSVLFKNKDISDEFESDMAKFVANDSMRRIIFKDITDNIARIRANDWNRTYSAPQSKDTSATGSHNGGGSTGGTIGSGGHNDLGLDFWLIATAIALIVGSLIYWLVLIIKSKKDSRVYGMQETASASFIDEEKPEVEDSKTGDRNNEVDKDSIARLKSEKQKLESELKKKDNEVNRWKADVENRTKEIDSLKVKIENNKDQITNLKQQVAERTNEINILKQAVVDSNNEISGLKQTIVDNNNKIVFLNNTIKENEELGREFKSLSTELISRYYDTTFSRLRNNELEGKAQQQMLLSNLISFSIHVTSLLRKNLGRAASSDIDNLELLKGQYVQPKGTVNEHSPQYSCDEMAYAVFQLLREHGVHKLDNVLVHGYKIGE